MFERYCGTAVVLIGRSETIRHFIIGLRGTGREYICVCVCVCVCEREREGERRREKEREKRVREKREQRGIKSDNRVESQEKS